MKKKDSTLLGTVPNPNRKIIERGQVNTPNTHVHDQSLSWLGTATSIKRGGVELVLWAQTSALFEM